MKSVILTLLLLLFAAQSSAETHSLDKLGADQSQFSVRVDKSARIMFLLQDNRVIKWYRIALGANPKGHKIREGDKRTPEGNYTLDFINEKSRFYRSIRINYPNSTDIARAERLGVDPGGQIMIHGQKNGINMEHDEARTDNWTDGCIAISNDEMDEFLSLIPVGTPIEIDW
ncbi:L,D-transpeptidase family protein [Enterovibrio sp. ZSDZ35]|uniref:L,D-transpeptidase family protein n=1 Tax=Enterovibrio qingdaonensis TaxID=2899818 RepID=A0ABT5QIH2_9GAMM|nr:L,D-transpeptidase family protein [Enterovibrio sp. ZSDZ35]MDD1780270.1 L,D-transpeptidase family protein [Enterovibrio sp. ZSDZ35]